MLKDIFVLVAHFVWDSIVCSVLAEWDTRIDYRIWQTCNIITYNWGHMCEKSEVGVARSKYVRELNSTM